MEFLILKSLFLLRESLGSEYTVSAEPMFALASSQSSPPPLEQQRLLG